MKAICEKDVEEVQMFSSFLYKDPPLLLQQ